MTMHVDKTYFPRSNSEAKVFEHLENLETMFLVTGSKS